MVPAPRPAAHEHYPFYAAGVAYCGCTEHFGLTPVQADAELPDAPTDPPTDLIVRAEQKRRADIAARRAQKRNRQAGGAS